MMIVTVKILIVAIIFAIYVSMNGLKIEMIALPARKV